MLLGPPFPNVGVLPAGKAIIFFPGKSNIDKGEGVISKVMLPSPHFSP